MAYTPSDPVVPSEHDAALAKKAQLLLEGRDVPVAASMRVQIATTDHEDIALDLPPLVAQLLIDILKETAAGNAISLIPVEAEITTHQAATILNVSRPYLVGLVDKGMLPARLVGTHRRLPLREVLAYKATHFAKRSQALDELVAHDRVLGLL